MLKGKGMGRAEQALKEAMPVHTRGDDDMHQTAVVKEIYHRFRIYLETGNDTVCSRIGCHA